MAPEAASHGIFMKRIIYMETVQDRETTSKSTCPVHQTGKMHEDIFTLFNIFTVSFFRNCPHFASYDHNIHFEALLGPQ